MNPLPLELTTIIKLFIGNYYSSLFSDEPDSVFKYLYPQWAFYKTLYIESGYMHIQATKPDTIGAALYDSPAGLLAYILEKFSTWTNKSYIDQYDGGLNEVFTKDELITNVMIYYLSNNIVPSMRYYKESFSSLFYYKLDR